MDDGVVNSSTAVFVHIFLCSRNKRSTLRQDDQQRVQQVRTQLVKQFDDEKRTSPNSTGTSSSPLSSSYLSRLSSSTDNSPVRPPVLLRNQNTIPSSTVLPSSASSNGIQQSPTKQLDSVTLLLKQAIVPSQIFQVQTRLENPTKYHLEQMCRKQLTDDDNDDESLSLEQPPQQHQLSSTNQILQDVSSPESERNSEVMSNSIENVGDI
ncbi:unnamed protein product [Didymodactylos carnosus]|uniref:MiT/TFE transcription factors N-terminal domain-containing protein n=1 Tax=Didymodactylos carnosus TaxID=1234261 RepID=A0A8S2P9V1_9BILA|nr:unnamed protein product [Didymodactylos carnosus]CAF4038640.1 unnamed protein product [Didymodactylos carnosus]